MKSFLAVLVFLVMGAPAFAQEHRLETPIRDSAERLVASITAADNRVSGARGFDDIEKPKKEKFFGATNLLMGVGLGLSAGYDVKTTFDVRGLLGPNPTRMPDGSLFSEQRFLQADGSTRTVSLSFREKTGFYRSSVIEGNKGKVWGKKAIVNAPIWVASHYMRRSPHKIIKVGGYVLPVLAMGIQVKAGLDNKVIYDKWRAELH